MINSISSAVPRFDSELTLKHKRQQYETSNNVKFFKCNVKDIDDPLPAAFEVKDVPTYIFYRKEKECGRLLKPKKEDLIAKLDELVKQKPKKEDRSAELDKLVEQKPNS